jgi:hypothetical protein
MEVSLGVIHQFRTTQGTAGKGGSRVWVMGRPKIINKQLGVFGREKQLSKLGHYYYYTSW